MAEVTRRSFDLKSWQGLTDVLKVARESSLPPLQYAEFRNLVLQYAQQKGSDPELKKRIESIIQTFTEEKESETHVNGKVNEELVLEDEKKIEAPAPAPASHFAPHGGGRRTVPVFASPHNVPAPVDTMSADKEEMTVEPMVAPEPSVMVDELPKPVAVSEAPVIEDTLKTTEEHRARILEIKRRVNSLVGNPVTLMDHGNNVGRVYMTALLSALKATSPGSTQNIESAMNGLESAFAKILAMGSGDAPDEQAEENVPHKEGVPTVEAASSVPESSPEVVMPIAPNEAEEVPVAEVALPSAVIEPSEEEIVEVVEEETIHEEKSTEEPQVSHDMEEPVAPEANRWSEAGGDADVRSQISALRETLKARQISTETQTEAPRTHRPLIPSLVDIEDEPVPPTPDSERPAVTQPTEYKEIIEAEELSKEALTNRPLSSMTGITLGTPQGELATQEVTGVLTELLHDWSIFASSGIFGMGPSGMDHPLYEQLSRLPMGEVLSGRFENADMKLVRNIKEYVNAWRHEQGIAYNPTETFEHYLRRVAQRILKRQNCIKGV